MIILLLLIVFAIVLYVYSRRNHYWIQRDVKHESVVPLSRNDLKHILGLKSDTERITDLYQKYPDKKVVGYYKGNQPVFIVKDLELIKQVMNIDFSYFFDRGLDRQLGGYGFNLPYLKLGMYNAKGDTWKLLRSRLPAAFTGAKLRAMFPLVVRCAEKLQEKYAVGGEYDAKELMEGFTIEFIGACGFGIDMDTINEEESPFRELGKRIFEKSFTNKLIYSLTDIVPGLNNYIRSNGKQIEDMILKILMYVRKSRDGKPSGRNDFMDLLLKMEEESKLVVESMEKTEADGSPSQVEMTMDLELMAGQLFVFFASGYQPSALVNSYILYELAINPKIQEKAQEEIDMIMLKYGKLCYEAVAEMLYLEMIFKEGLRKYPTGGNLMRVCMKKYTFPEVDLTIDPGVRIMIPVEAIHMDKKYYEKSEEFRPERFAPEAMRHRHKYSYLPFGAGPRSCIGSKLGQMQSLAALAAILHKFNVEPSPNTTRKLKVNPSLNMVQSIQGGLPLLFSPRKKE